MGRVRPAHRAGTTDRQYYRNRAITLASTDICCRCGGRVDRSVPPRHPRAPSLEHLVPLALGGHPTDIRNMGQAHYGCNSSAGAKMRRHIRRRNADEAARSTWAW